MNTWLIGVDIEVSDLEFPSYFLIQAESLTLAEAGVVYMGGTWWQECLEQSDGCRWGYRSGKSVWFNSITLLDDVESSILQGLKFLDVWVVTGDLTSPRVQNQFNEQWEEFTR